MIAVLDIDHPDIKKFITCKANNTGDKPVLEKFNISVGVTDTFIEAVKQNADWELKFNGKIYEIVKANELWESIVHNAWAKAEPGVLFIDNINKNNNLWYCEEINSCNPCGEQPLPPYGACNLGAINLTQFVIDPFGKNAKINYEDLQRTVKTSVQFLDNTIDINYYPLDAQRKEAEDKRRVGLGIMGLGSALAMLKIRYGSDESLEVIDSIFRTIRDTAYKTSVELAKDKGSFPLFDREKYLQGVFIKSLPDEIKESIEKVGIRNSHLLTIAPTGSISQIAGNVSSGVEPIFSLQYTRKNYNDDVFVEDYAWKIYKAKGSPDGDRPKYFVTAHELSWEEHLRVMGMCQKYIDSAISKTINLPREVEKKSLQEVYLRAWEIGLKGCTIYREGSLDGEVLSMKKPPATIEKGRPYKLEGRTYKIKPPESKHAFYLTFTHKKIEDKKRPFELFINTKNPVYDEWVKALGRLVSSVFRNVEDPTFLIEDFKEIMGKTGFWSTERKKYVPSLTAEFGEVMKDYFIDIGLLDSEVPVEIYERNNNIREEKNSLLICFACGEKAAIYEEGCFKCTACGYNKCG